MKIDTTKFKPIKRGRIPKPFLKWVGGKTQILLELRKRYPAEFNCYYEPFLGGGAVFFDIQPSKAIISDANKELTNCYKVIKNDVEKLIRSLGKHVYDKDYYYTVRDQDPMSLDPVKRAARTIFLNRSGFNGLYRVNSKGKFNVPFGRYKNPRICDPDNLRGCARALSHVKIKSTPFESVLKEAKRGDFVYFDPPYIPVSDTSYFTAYQKHGFGMNNQEKLADVFEQLANRGVHVVLSNSDVTWIHKRYRDFRIRVIQANRLVNSNAGRRGPVGEVVVTSS